MTTGTLIYCGLPDTKGLTGNIKAGSHGGEGFYGGKFDSLPVLFIRTKMRSSSHFPTKHAEQCGSVYLDLECVEI